VRKPEEKRPNGGQRLRWESDIKMDRKEIIWEAISWMNLAQDTDSWKAVVYTVTNLRDP
jgi:hypothetical protein